MKKLVQWLCSGILTLTVHASAYAVSATDFKNTSGAGNKRLDDVMKAGQGTAQTSLDTLLIFFTVAGVGLVGFSLWQMWKASKDERERPVSAVVGLIVGGAMTVVALITGFSANTVSG